MPIPVRTEGASAGLHKALTIGKRALGELYGGRCVVSLLLVEDDTRIAAALAAALEQGGFAVEHAASAAEALAAEESDLILLDLGLPDMDGLELCRQIRARSTVPIIAVTARGTPAERVAGLKMGADDYLVKPFSLPELHARIEAVLRRTGLTTQRAKTIEIGDVVIDQRSNTVTVAGAHVQLSRKEYDLLVVLASDPDRAFTRADLLLEVWHTGWEGKSRTVDVHVGLIRQKTGRPELIKTIHGVGYKLLSQTSTDDG